MTLSLLNPSDRVLQILRISIHYASGNPESKPIFKGQHARVSLRVSKFDLQQILGAEIAGEHDQYIDGKIEHRSGREWGDMLVAGNFLPFMRWLSS